MGTGGTCTEYLNLISQSPERTVATGNKQGKAPDLAHPVRVQIPMTSTSPYIIHTFYYSCALHEVGYQIFCSLLHVSGVNDVEFEVKLLNLVALDTQLFVLVWPMSVAHHYSA